MFQEKPLLGIEQIRVRVAESEEIRVEFGDSVYGTERTYRIGASRRVVEPRQTVFSTDYGIPKGSDVRRARISARHSDDCYVVISHGVL